jgi:hypothetical protein
MSVDENEYGVILRDADGRAVPEGIKRFRETLETGKQVALNGRDWVVESINERVWPPIVFLTPAAGDER